jgi:ribonuclease P protein subunit RPR2
MVRIARERVSDLFALAEREAGAGHGELADRYVSLARRIGMRYNVRVPAEYREVYCRGCSGFWIEGRTVRSRLRSGLRIRTCLRCGRVRRVRLRAGPATRPDMGGAAPEPIGRDEGALAVPVSDDDGAQVTDEESEEE